MVHSPGAETLLLAPGNTGSGHQRALPGTSGLPGRCSAPPPAPAGPRIPQRILFLFPKLKRASINTNHKQMVILYNTY